jgi:prefoldin subunit 5
MITAFLLAMMTLAVFPLAAQASTGNIYINATSASVVGQQVAAGGSVNLYVGSVTWSGAQFYLMMSSDGFSQVSTGDSRYSALFDVTNVTAGSGSSTYTYQGGTWTVGQGWINGTIQKNLAGGNYWIKAFDGATTSVAVTDTYITITPAFFVSPTSNAPNTPITLSGFAFKANALVNLTYVNPVTLAIVPIATLVSANASGIFEYTMNAPDLNRAGAAGANAIVTNVIIFNAINNATGTTYSTVTGFSQSARGLLQVKRTGVSPSEQLPGAGNVFGNLTDFTLTGSLPITNVGVNNNIIIAGNRFFPGNASLKWDNGAVLATAAVNATGFFNTTIAVPITPIGLHNVTMVDANGQIFVIFLTVVPSVTLSPTSGKVGATVTATGYGFPATIGTAKVNATLEWPGLSAYIASAFTDSAGTWTATFVVPQSVGGAVTLTAYNNVTGSFVSTATATFTVTAGFAVTPSSFANSPTLVVEAAGTGFNPTEYFTVNIDNQALAIDPQLATQASSIRANASGYLSVSFIGCGFTPGVHVISLYDWGAFANGSIIPTVWATFTVLSTGDPTINAVNALNNSINAVQTAITGQLTAISGSIATIQTSIGSVQTSVSSLGATISSVNSGIATITSNVGSISTQLSNLNAAIVAVQGDIATVSTSLGTITTSLASLDTKVTAIQGSIATVQTSIGTLQGTITSINGDVATIKTGVGTLQTSVGTVQTDVTSTKDNTSGMSTLIYVAIAFALIAAIAAVASILLMRKKIAS